MPQEGVRETVEREVGFLIDPTAHFISLVHRGANQTPFRVVKTKKEGDGEMPKVLQAIIAPKDLSKDVVSSIFTEETRQLLKFDKSSEHGAHVSFEQLPRTAFKADSFELVVLDAQKGVKGLRAEPLETGKPSLITRLFKTEEKPQEAIELPEDVPAVDVEVAKSEYTDKCFSELYNATDAIRAILAQERGEPGQKMQMVKVVLSNLEQFLDETLTVTKEEALTMPEPEVAKKEEAQKAPEAPEVQAKEPEATAVAKTEPAASEPVAQTKEPAVSDPVVMAKLDELATALAGLEEKVTKMQKQVAPVPSKESDPVVQKSDKPAGVFDGLFLK